MKAYGKSDKGRVRATNQDAFAIDIRPNVCLLVVCDGMGGANAGNVASRFATEQFMEVLRHYVQQGDLSQMAIRKMLTEATREANQRVYGLSRAQPEFSGMGTTLVGAVVTENLLTIVNVGDSRAYCIGKHGAEQLTIDHSYVEEMVRSGKLSREDAKHHPKRNLITRAVGVDEEVVCDLYEVHLTDDEMLLLCSDGLSGMVSDENIAALLQQPDSMEKVVEALMDAAYDNGGVDNITAVLFQRGNAEK